MTPTELEAVIRKYLMDIYKVEYLGKIEIEKLEPQGYCVKLGLSMPHKPYIICGWLDDKAFLKYLKEEIKSMRFNLIDYGLIKLKYRYDCEPIDKSCKCQRKN